jgi:hypothetical protein
MGMAALGFLAAVAVAALAGVMTYRMASQRMSARDHAERLLFFHGLPAIAVVLSTLVALLVLSAFLRFLFPPFFEGFQDSYLFVWTYIGLLIIAVLLTRQAMAWRRVGTVALLLLVVATVGELARHRTPSVPDPPKEQLYQELVVIAPADGQWSGWVDTHGVQARWSKNTRNDFIIGTDAGEAYESGAPVPTVRYVRFRAMNGIESRVLVAGQLSFAPVGTVPEPGRVELLPGGKLSALHDTVSAATVGSPPQGVLSPVEEKSRDSLFVALSAQLGASASSMSLGAWSPDKNIKRDVQDARVLLITSETALEVAAVAGRRLTEMGASVLYEVRPDARLPERSQVRYSSADYERAMAIRASLSDLLGLDLESTGGLSRMEVILTGRR